MKTRFLIAILTFISFTLFADDIKIERVEPPFWWTGMVNTDLQLLVYGTDISLTQPEINYGGIQVQNIIRVANPNYIFIDLSISHEAAPGIMDIKFSQNGKTLLRFPYTLKKRDPQSAFRSGFNRSDVVYLVMPDRFSNGNPSNDNVPGMLEKADRSNPNGRHGGDIQGIINHLDYMKNLGITTLWCTPLLENNDPEYSYHGYAITDFYTIDQRFGSNEDYVNLVKKTHETGLKIILDVVLNHCSIYNHIVQDLPSEDWIHQFAEYTASNFRAATITDPHASEFDRNRMLDGWFDKHMADLNQQNKLVAKYLIQNTIWWIEFSGIDGIRLDTQPYSSKEFVSTWAKRIFDEYPDFNIVGEAWLQQESITAYFQKDAFNRDGYNSNIPVVTDFPMFYALEKAFTDKDSWTDGLARIYNVLAQDFLYSHPEVNAIFLDNHDLNRYFTSVQSDLKKWKMAVSCLLTMRGMPVIFYGTELLKTGDKKNGDGFTRTDFPGGWPGDTLNAFTIQGRTPIQNEAFNYLQKLLTWRKKKNAVLTGSLKQFVPQDETYVYFRYTTDECIMVAFNNSKNQIKAIKGKPFAECMNGYTYGINVITGERVNYLDAFTLPPKSVLILDLKK